MNMEMPPTGENSEEKITREEAMNAYRKFVDQGITSPDVLGTGDPNPVDKDGNPEVKAANELFYKWQKQIDAEAGDDEELKLKAKLATSMFYVDAGFTDATYLEDVKEWINNDIPEKQEDNLERDNTLKMYEGALKRIEDILGKNN